MTTQLPMQAISGVADIADIRVALFINNELVHAPVESILPVIELTAANVEFDNTESGLPGNPDNVQDAIDDLASLAADLAAGVKWLSRGIGEIYMVDTSKTGVDIPPSSTTDTVWIELTAGLTGAGAFNEGKLTSESVSGSAPLVLATAVISVSGSPIDGQTVDLLNTEGRIIRPSTSPGTKQNDALQNITGSVSGMWGSGGSAVGAITVATGSPSTNASSSSNSSRTIGFDASLVARTATETRMKNVGVKAYMRVK